MRKIRRFCNVAPLGRFRFCETNRNLPCVLYVLSIAIMALLVCAGVARADNVYGLNPGHRQGPQRGRCVWRQSDGHEHGHGNIQRGHHRRRRQLRIPATRCACDIHGLVGAAGIQEV